MVFNNIFGEPEESKNEHPMTNPEYSNDIINEQGKQYNKYQEKRRAESIQKNKSVVEGVIESFTSSSGYGFIPINDDTESEVIDNILKQDEWEIKMYVTITANNSRWRNIFHYGNSNHVRAPAMWIFPRNPWKFHYRMKTNRSWNDGVDFDIPSQFRRYKEPLQIRILYHAVGNESKMTFFVNDIIVKSKDIGSFQRVPNQKFALKKNWGWYPRTGYTVSDFAMKDNRKPMTANEKNESELATLMKLQARYEAAVKTMNSAAYNSTDTANDLINDPENTRTIFNKYPADPGDVDGIGEFKGCRMDSRKWGGRRTLPLYQGIKTHEECAQRAHDLGKTAYGIQNAVGWGSNKQWGTTGVRNGGNKGECWIGDDNRLGWDRAYHSGWATYWTGLRGDAYYMYVAYNGALIFYNKNWGWTGQVGRRVSNCSYWPPVIRNVTATYGNNCQYETKYRRFLWWRIPYRSRRSSVYTGNATRNVNPSVENKKTGSVQVSAGRWGDPAYGCAKKFNATYNCGWGTNYKSINLSQEANGKRANFDCSNLPCKDKVPFRLVMQNDGNLVLYDKANEVYWHTGTNGKIGDTPNKNWMNSSNNIGDTLKMGRWFYGKQMLVSKSGRNMAKIVDGRLRVYQNWTNCREKNGETYGGPWTNAVYTIDKNDVSTLGTVSNAVEGNRRQWPDQFISGGANFTAIPEYSIEAEGGTRISGKSLDEYKKIAAGDEDIALFATPNSGGEAIFYKKDCDHQPWGKHCAGRGFPTLQSRIAKPGWTIYVKNPRITSNDTCGKESEGIPLSTYNSYKAGAPMRKCSPCGIASAMHDDYCTAQSESAKARREAVKVLYEMKQLLDQSIELQTVKPELKEQIYKNIKEYDVTYEKTKDNIDTRITTGAQKDDSDLKVVADNFQFVMWTIIAILAVSIAIKMTRKVK